MTLIEILKEWSGIALIVGGSVYGLVKYINDFRNAKEGVKQSQQHTKQERLTTDEKALDLDVRRVKASEEVASESLEDLAEVRQKYLEVLKGEFEKSEVIIQMQAEIRVIKAELAQVKEEKTVVGFFYCGNTNCELREPKLGTFSFNCISLEMLKKMMNNGTNS